MAEIRSIPEYATDFITPQERTRRAHIDSLIEKVHENHEWAESPIERQTLLKQYIRLPGDPKGLDVRVQLGEILVTFCNYELRRQYDSDESSDEDDGDIEASRRRAERRRTSRRAAEKEQKSTCLPVPLQYLYKLSDDRELRMDLSQFLRGRGEGGGNLRVIEFPTPYYADDLLKAMRNVSLGELINHPKASITKLKFNEHSSFLAGVSYYPRVAPRQFVTSQFSRITYPLNTLIFVAIPYLGIESAASALSRKEHPSLPNNNHLQDGVAERLTAYYMVDGHAKGKLFSNSSLSLFEYRFPSEDSPAAFNEWERVSNTETEGNPIVVHQVWLTALDDETIAVFRSPNDQSQSLPLFPHHCESVGGYHGIVNIIGSILPSLDTAIPRRFRQRVSEIEFLVETRPFEDDLVLRFDTLRIELSAITKVVGTQLQVLRNLARFQLDQHAEQFKVVGRAVDMIVEGRESFLREIWTIREDLQASQQLLFRILSMEKKLAQAEEIADQLARTKRVTEVATRSARENSAESVDTIVTTLATLFMPLGLITSYWGIPPSTLIFRTETKRSTGINMRFGSKPWKQREPWLGMRIPLSLSLIFLAIHIYCHRRLMALYRRRQSRSSESSSYPQSLVPLHLACIAQYAAFVALSPWVKRVNDGRVKASLAGGRGR